MNKPSVILGVTGGIAAYKVAEIARLLIKRGVVVDVVMTESACRFITPLTFEALTRRPVFTDLWGANARENNTGAIQHIDLVRNASAILIAPASANTIARLAHGIADHLLTALCLARACPLIVAPAMNTHMWSNPATRRNVRQLQSDGVVVLETESGVLACGEEGEGRLLPPQTIVDALFAELSHASSPPTHSPFLLPSKPLSGRRVLMTAGPTFEAIDPVRGLTNRSSGKMGFALASAARDAGAQVTLVTGPVALATPENVERVDVVSANDMAHAVFARAIDYDIFIGVAAVADYTPEQSADHKLKKEEFPALSLTLKPTIDILNEVVRYAPHIYRVGFAAETRNLTTFGEEKRKRKRLPLLILNHAVNAIGADDNEVTLLDDDGAHHLPRMNKTELARHLMDAIAQRFNAISAQS